MDIGRSITPPPTSHPDLSCAPISFAAGSAAMFFSIGYPFLFLVSAVATLLLYFNLNSMTETSKHDMTSVGIHFLANIALFDISFFSHLTPLMTW